MRRQFVNALQSCSNPTDGTILHRHCTYYPAVFELVNHFLSGQDSSATTIYFLYVHLQGFHFILQYMKTRRKFVGNESVRNKNKGNKATAVMSLIVEVNDNRGFLRELLVNETYLSIRGMQNHSKSQLEYLGACLHHPSRSCHNKN